MQRLATLLLQHLPQLLQLAGHQLLPGACMSC
jgi:hypothetical protein